MPPSHPQDPPEMTQAQRLDMLDRIVSVMAGHQNYLVDQIAEAVVTTRKLTEQQAELTGRLAAIETRLPGLISEGLVAAVGNPAMWAAGRKAASEHASQAAGGWLIGGMRSFAGKVVWAAVAVAVVYNMGGLSAVSALFKWKSSQ
jgi:hypothetical protein